MLVRVEDTKINIGNAEKRAEWISVKDFATGIRIPIQRIELPANIYLREEDIGKTVEIDIEPIAFISEDFDLIPEKELASHLVSFVRFCTGSLFSTGSTASDTNEVSVLQVPVLTIPRDVLAKASDIHLLSKPLFLHQPNLYVILPVGRDVSRVSLVSDNANYIQNDIQVDVSGNSIYIFRDIPVGAYYIRI